MDASYDFLILEGLNGLVQFAQGGKAIGSYLSLLKGLQAFFGR